MPSTCLARVHLDELSVDFPSRPESSHARPRLLHIKSVQAKPTLVRSLQSQGSDPASPLQNTFRTPVYTTSMRRNAMGVGLVFEADLFTAKHISHWVLQGVCLTLNSD